MLVGRIWLKDENQIPPAVRPYSRVRTTRTPRIQPVPYGIRPPVEPNYPYTDIDMARPFFAVKRSIISRRLLQFPPPGINLPPINQPNKEEVISRMRIFARELVKQLTQCPETPDYQKIMVHYRTLRAALVYNDCEKQALESIGFVEVA